MFYLVLLCGSVVIHLLIKPNKMSIKNFINQLKSDLPIISHIEDEKEITVNHSIGKIDLEFTLEYSQEIENHRSGTREHPEEGDVVFHNVDHKDVYLHIGEEMLEPSVNELHEIHSILGEFLYMSK